MVWLLLLSCEPAEPAAPNWNRCMDEASDEDRTNCCYKAGQRDCQNGFLAIEVLHGPQNAAQPQEAEDFVMQCDLDIDGEGADLYCAGYCASCPDYEDWSSLHFMDPWSGDEQSTNDWRNDCYCQEFVEDTTHVRCQ